MADNTYSKADNDIEIARIDNILASQRLKYSADPYPEYQQRINDLTQLKTAIVDNQQRLVDAMNADFSCRSQDDSKLGDIMTAVMGINYTIKKLKSWMKPEKRHVSALFQPANAKVMYQPLGVVGIINPWNYPVFLAVGPLTTTLVAGNRAMIKMSEFTPATNTVLQDILSTIFSEDKVAVITGGPEVAAHFSSQKFDHIIFTGSTRVGKIVMAAAAQNLTPVTLELGGKSPAIIADDIDINTAVSRFILAKVLNAGQTCVAPDYILCPKGKVDQLVAEVSRQFQQLYPNFSANTDYTHIINDAQYSRLNEWLSDAENKGAIIKPAVDAVNADRKMPVTMLLNTTDEMLVMQEEIFGPLLPIIGYDSIDEAIAYVNARPRPLALYLFSFNNSLQKRILKYTHAGGVCINDAAMHVATDDLPFGGVGASGMGHYHAKEGFISLSKAKPIFTRGKVSFSHFVFPPFGGKIQQLIYKLFIR